MTLSKIRDCIKCLSVATVVIVVGGLGFVYSGLYPMGADVPHNKLTFWVLETLRERSLVPLATLKFPQISPRLIDYLPVVPITMICARYVT